MTPTPSKMNTGQEHETNGEETKEGEIETEKAKKEEEKSKKEEKRIARYDEIYNYRTYEWKLVKSAKPKKPSNKKPILVVRREFDYKNRHTGTYVDIKSSGLAAALIECNENVDGLGLNQTPPSSNVTLFYHSRKPLLKKLQIEKAKEQPDETLLLDLQTGVDFAGFEHQKTIAHMSTLLAAGECTWELLWALFPPGSLVYHFHKYTQEPMILRFRSMVKRKRPEDGIIHWRITCDVIVDNGVRFGLGTYPEAIEIDPYPGARKIKDLIVVPLDFTDEEEELRKILGKRGKRYTEIAGAKFYEVSGLAVREEINPNENWKTKRFSFTAYGRAMIDTATFKSHNPDCQYTPTIHSVLERDKLKEDEYLICLPYIQGFSFGNKRWGGFAISKLEPIFWGKEAFNSLVLEPKRKKLIHSLVKQHSLLDDKYDDLVSGKGKGLIILLSGNPGCGKTLTAEAVAEVTKKPLYMVSAGELGTKPEDVDKALTQALTLAHKWDAVMLLDEADVFLQVRDTVDLERNALVSIFLRQLEYYQGILILTTNRIGDCDPAFESRIHISLHYPDLGFDARKAIWKTFIGKAQKYENDPAFVGEEEIDRLAALNLNGRQIKNLVGSARSLALDSEEHMDASHITTVVDIMTDWKKLRG